MKLLICLLGVFSSIAADSDLLLKNSNDQFTATMFQEVVNTAENKNKNVILSAFSVLPPLGQLCLAAEGPSHDELLTAIGLPSDNDVKTVFSHLNKQLKAVEGVTLKMANRIYVAKNAKLNKNFAELSRDVFNSDVINLDFSQSQQSANDINAWVEEQTNNKIKNLVEADDLDETTRSVLVNAIYFKGSWADKFDVKKTEDKDFHVSKDKTIKVPTMYKESHFSYGESADLNAQLLELPYQNKSASLLIVLPNEIDGLADLESRLKNPAVLNKAVGEMRNQKVQVHLPKFKIETTTQLSDILKKMKITKIFSPAEARLNNLLENESGLYVSKAVQKAFIEVNEEGAEAAAANAFIVNYRSAKIFEPVVKSFVADHPFYFELRYRSNGNEQTLFNGVYAK